MPLGDGSCVLEVGSPSFDELAVWVALIGFDVDVLDPPELAEVVRDLAGRLARVGT